MKTNVVCGVAIAFGACWLGGGVTPASGQAIAARPVSSIEQVTRQILSRKVSLDLDAVPLKTAIEAAAARGQTRASYSLSLVESYTVPVSVHAADMDLGSVFAKILQGTALRVVGMPGGQLAIVRDESAPRSVEDGIIAGTVIHAKTKQPVAGAIIQLEGLSQSVTTGSDGAYRIVVEEGTYRVSIRAIGMLRQSQQVVVRSGQTVTLEVALEPSASVLDEVVVTGTVIATERKAITTPITVITAEDIEKRGIRRIEEFFRGEVPGVIAIDKGARPYDGRVTANADGLGAMVSSDVYVRGASNIPVSGSPATTGAVTPLKTFVDGVELLDPAYLGTIDPQSIERIEIITGPQAATIYGAGAMGGVMQIFTKRGGKTSAMHGTVNINTGWVENSVSRGKTPSHNANSNLSGGIGTAFSYAATLSHSYTGQWQPGLHARTVGGSIGVSYMAGRVTVNGSAAYTIGRNGTMTYPQPQSVEDIQSGKNKTLTASPAEFTSKRTSMSLGQTNSLTIDHKISDNVHQNITLGRNQTTFSLNPVQPVFGTVEDTLYHASSSSGGRTTYGYNMTIAFPSALLSQSLTWGINGSVGTQTRVYGCIPEKTGTSYIQCTDREEVGVSKPISSNSIGGFGSWRIGVFDRLFLTFGLRGEHSPNYGESHNLNWTPTNGIAYTMQPGPFTIKVLGSYGRATRSPTQDMRLEEMRVNPNYEPSTYVYRLANPDLRPEVSQGPQGGIEVYYGSVASVTINRYKQEIRDLIQGVPPTDTIYVRFGSNDHYPLRQYQFVNIAKVRQHGWESVATISLAGLTAKGVYSWADSRVVSVDPTGSGAAGISPGATFHGVPTHTASVTLGYASGATSVMLVSNYVGASTRSSGSRLYIERLNRRLSQYLDRKLSGNSPWSGPGYVKTNVSVSHRLQPWLSMTTNITNITNNYGSEVAWYQTGIGRRSTLGLSMRFPSRSGY